MELPGNLYKKSAALLKYVREKVGGARRELDKVAALSNPPK